MSISPVMSSSFNVSGSVNFGSAKKRKNQINVNHKSSANYTVPLAAAISMMPLNVIKAENPKNVYLEPQGHNIELVENYKDPDLLENPRTANFTLNTQQNDEGRVIESKRFSSRKFSNYLVKLVDEDGDPSNFESVKFQIIYKGEPLTAEKMKYIEKINYIVNSDDGTKITHPPIRRVTMDAAAGATYNSKAVLDYLDALKNDKRNNGAIKEINCNRDVCPKDFGILDNDARGDIMKNAQGRAFNGDTIFSADLSDNGKVQYTLRYYKEMDEGTGKPKLVATLQKPDHDELEIFMVYSLDQCLSVTDEEYKFIKTGIVVLKDKNNKSYYIDNPEMVDVFTKVIETYPDLKDAYPILKGQNDYVSGPGGYLVPSLSD